MTTADLDSPASPTASRPGLRGKSGYLLLSLGVLFLDQLSKGWIEATYALHARREIIPGLLNFTHVRNRGVAFGLFASHGDAATGAIVLSLLGLAAMAVVGLYFWRTPRHHRLLLAALGLILGGAVGNLVDRLGSGAVTDFVDFYVGTYHWHTFNVADSAITVGIALMVLDLFRSPPEESGSASAS